MRAWFIRRMPSVGPVLGASVPRTQMAPSSRCGRNSEPIMPLAASYTVAARAAPRPTPTVTQRSSIAHRTERAVALRQQVISRIVPFACVPAERTAGQHRAPAACEKISAPSSAKATVQAMGLNSRPSTRLQREDRQVGRDDDARSRRIPAAALRARLRECVPSASSASRSCWPMWRTMFSTITTAPSTTMPKSSAPSDSRFAGMCRRSRQIGGEQQRKRNGQRHDQRAAHVAQEQEQNDRHQDDAFGQVVQHRVGGEVHQVAAVQERHDLHALAAECASFSSSTFSWMRVQRGIGFARLCAAARCPTPRRRRPGSCRPRGEWPCRFGPAGSSAPASPLAISLMRIGVPFWVLMTVFLDVAARS